MYGKVIADTFFVSVIHLRLTIHEIHIILNVQNYMNVTYIVWLWYRIEFFCYVTDHFIIQHYKIIDGNTIEM